LTSNLSNAINRRVTAGEQHESGKEGKMKKSSLIFQLTAFLVFINKLLTKDRGERWIKN